MYSNPTPYPSVTEILRPWIDTEWFTDEGRIRGTAVHAACAAHLLNQYVIPLKQEWRGYFDSFQLWCDIAHPSPVFVEHRLTDSELGYCGKPDFFGTIRGEKDSGIIDLKTSTAIGKYWPIQNAAYSHLTKDIVEADLTRGEWSMSLRLRADGKMPLASKYFDQFTYFNLFLGALNIHKFFKE